MFKKRYVIPPLVCSVFFAILLSPSLAALDRADLGKQLFSGQTAFEKGGAPCLACHGMTGLGLASGANYGPDLSQLYDNYGPEGLEAILPSLAFPSMEAIYTDRPLSEEEQADLIAFFRKAANLSAQPDTTEMTIHLISGIIALFLFSFLVGLRRIRTVRRSLVERQRNIIAKGGLQ